MFDLDASSVSPSVDIQGGRRYTGEMGYTKKNVFVTKIFIYIGALGLMYVMGMVMMVTYSGAASVGFTGNARFTDSIGGLFDYVLEIIEDVRSLVISIQTPLVDIFTTVRTAMVMVMTR